MKELNGYQYEHTCAQNLKKRGFTNVEVTKGSCDQGIDIVAHKNGLKYGIQCKYYSGKVGNKAVQEAYAGAKYYNCDKSVVMTNSSFTKSAKELAKKTDVLLWENNHIPFSLSPFRITKWTGIFSCFVSSIALLSMKGATFIKYPVLQLMSIFFLF